MAQLQHTTLSSYTKLYYLSHKPREGDQQAENHSPQPFSCCHRLGLPAMVRGLILPQGADKESEGLIISHPCLQGGCPLGIYQFPTWLLQAGARTVRAAWITAEMCWLGEKGCRRASTLDVCITSTYSAGDWILHLTIPVIHTGNSPLYITTILCLAL